MCEYVVYLYANTATDAKLFRYGGYLAVGRHFYAEFSHSNDGTRPLAFLPTTLRLTLVRVDDGYTCQPIGFLHRFFWWHLGSV